MSIRLRELIRSVRACKTAAEEREVIAKESAALREAFRDQDYNEYRHRNVAKLMYIHMLGYPTHFGQMETLKLIAASGFPEKRIGYLGLMILLDERQEVLMLVTNSLKFDLNHKNQYIAGLALAAFGNICSAEMARDLAPDIERLMECSNPYLRKKAAVCAIRVLKKVPELLESFVDRAGKLLGDKNHNVVLAGTSLLLQICEMDRESVPALRSKVPTLCKILRSLLQAGNSPEHDVGGITDPFLQVKILRLLRYLGADNADASDQMSDILAQVAANIEGARNAGNAILYECVQTIMGVEAIGGLRVLAVNLLGRFLSNKDNNIRYVALSMLSKVVSIDTQAVQRHRTTIVECVKDADVSIRRRALELVYSLVNETNIKALTRDLLDYLAVSDSEFKPDLTAKVCLLVQRFSPSKRWHVDQMLQVLTQAGNYVKEEVCNSLIVLITNAPELHGYSVRAMYRSLVAYQDVAATSLLTTATWCVGEFGEMLMAGAGGALLEEEPALNVSDSDVVGLIEAVARSSKSERIVREFAVTAAMKLTARLPSQMPRLRALVAKYSKSSQLEVQARSAEYVGIFRHEAIRPQLLERMPALDESNYLHNMGAATQGGTCSQLTSAGGTVPAGAPTPAPAIDLLGLDLLGGDSIIPTVAAPVNKSAADALDDLLGGVSPAPAGAPAAAKPASELLDLLGGGCATPAPGPPRPGVFAPIVAWQQPGGGGITVRFSFTKHPTNPAVTEVTGTYSNAGPVALTNFNLQAAVPKFMQLQLEPASGTTLEPNNVAPVTQRILVNNTLHGQKMLMMRLRISYTNAEGANVVEQTEVANFPAGL